MKKKEIKFSIKKGSFKDKCKNLDDLCTYMEKSLEEIDASIDKMDREFKEFQMKYGQDKGVEDWLDYVEKEKRIQKRKFNLRIEDLSFHFRKRLKKHLKKSK
ncbi:hypothetical protein F9Y90_05590 (plasmid) [Borrelia miyamotoi]|uniref:Uncharacterized protein n=1 Tax=Borrelia miyamotoi TaxID=47466 RepID=A0AAQ3HE92_9SPIR|nr:hypothetical protein [Borrelia miyamotoi]ATQ17902.1 hypothetical protein CNO12_06345 [Borrelia miyamotoi]ATQ20378.1 hypothetical protein CNO10_06245 [Borrelia miyamotoi]ATQ21601.1 hypothetical protein CNO09_05970 [Borrelia miyamotoi]QBK62563.1 hypothetical protein EZU67_05275 [Borrelia miyamotoi]QBK64036.1 hypothetical protein EZU68_06595 [Borrelia miyamotoi]